MILNMIKKLVSAFKKKPIEIVNSPIAPWMTELQKVMGLHESHDNVKLSEWLKKDKLTVGDPKKYAWCGDAAETAIKLTLPKEVFKNKLKVNPYWARNWLLFGKPVIFDYYGMVLVFSRSGGGGHVGFAVAYDAKTKNYLVRGGNQSDKISDTWIAAHRLIGKRWPESFPIPQKADLPHKDKGSTPLSPSQA